MDCQQEFCLLTTANVFFQDFCHVREDVLLNDVVLRWMIREENPINNLL